MSNFKGVTLFLCDRNLLNSQDHVFGQDSNAGHSAIGLISDSYLNGQVAT